MYLHQKIVHAMITLYRINCQKVNTCFTFLGSQFHFPIWYKDNNPYQSENEPGNQSLLEIYFLTFLWRSGKNEFKFLFLFKFILFSLLNKREWKWIKIHFLPRINGSENKFKFIFFFLSPINGSENKLEFIFSFTLGPSYCTEENKAHL